LIHGGSGLIEAAENEFNLVVEEEIQRRIKEQETQDEQDKKRKSPKLKKRDDTDTTLPESDADDQKQSQEADLENGTDNGDVLENGQSQANEAVEVEA
jgi:hypothetical protein